MKIKQTMLVQKLVCTWFYFGSGLLFFGQKFLYVGKTLEGSFTVGNIEGNTVTMWVHPQAVVSVAFNSYILINNK